MSVGFDSNIFIYSFDRSNPAKQAVARRLVSRLLAGRLAVPMQVISESLNVAHRKRHLIVPDARKACEALAEALHIVPAGPQDAAAASIAAERYKLQFYDAQMVTVYARLGATILLSEDMQDGLRLSGVQVLSPFNPGNADTIEASLPR